MISTPSLVRRGLMSTVSSTVSSTVALAKVEASAKVETSAKVEASPGKAVAPRPPPCFHKSHDITSRVTGSMNCIKSCRTSRPPNSFHRFIDGYSTTFTPPMESAPPSIVLKDIYYSPVFESYVYPSVIPRIDIVGIKLLLVSS